MSKYRDRSKLDLTKTHIEIQTSNYSYLKAVARAKQKTMSQYLDELLARKREKHESHTNITNSV